MRLRSPSGLARESEGPQHTSGIVTNGAPHVRSSRSVQEKSIQSSQGFVRLTRMSEQLQAGDRFSKSFRVGSAEKDLPAGGRKDAIGHRTEDASQALDRATLRADARCEDRSVEVS